MILNKKIKAVNFNIDTYKKKIFIYGIAKDKEERSEVITEAKTICFERLLFRKLIIMSNLIKPITLFKICLQLN